MQRKSFVLLAIVALLVAACGCAPAAAPAGEQPTSGEKTVLRVRSHQNPSFIQANETVIAKFMEQNPDIEVTYEQFLSLIHI